MNMFYAVVHYPNIDTYLINQFRKMYDPQCHLIEPHITLVFLLSDMGGIRSARPGLNSQGPNAIWKKHTPTR
jgi:hypothetical protein